MPTISEVTAATTARPGRHSLELLRFGACTMDAAKRILLRDDVPVPLRRQVFDLLLLLVQRRPDTVPLDELRVAVWGRAHVAPSAIARAVLEARRAIGDSCPEARLIVNVHGVGYRFDAELQEGALALQPAHCQVTGLEKVEAHLREAENAYNLRADVTRARYHAEMALAEAMRRGLQVASGQALCWLGWLALWSGSLEEATRHVQHAMQLAHSENHAELQARARTVDACVHLSLGDFDRALTLLSQAHPVLLKDGRASDCCLCENLMSIVAKHLGQLDTARQWCLDALRHARAAGLPLAVLRAQSAEVEIVCEQGEAWQRQGQPGQARQAWEQALDTCQQLLPQIDPGIDPWLLAGCLGNEAVLLSRLGRFGQAREAMCRLERVLQHYGQPHSPAVQERRARIGLLRVRLCVLEGDHARALCEVQAALAVAEARVGNGPWKAPLLELASQVAESCGRLDLALRWAREHHAAQSALAGAQAQRLLQTLQVRSQQAALVEQLEAARRKIGFLEQMNAELLQRLPAARHGTHTQHRAPPGLI